jgi:predicted MFS family arabinose efflux permease
MNKRGNAFGAFNGVFGVLWFLGSVTMGLLYDRHALAALVGFGVIAQVASAGMFWWIRKPIAMAAQRG